MQARYCTEKLIDNKATNQGNNSLFKAPQNITAICDIRRCEKGEVLSEVNSAVHFCYYIKKGRIVSYDLLPNGQEIYYQFIEANTLFLETELLLNQPSTTSYRAETDAEVIRISQSDILQYLQGNPQAALQMVASLSQKYNSIMAEIQEMHSHDAMWRLCKLMLKFSNTYGIFNSQNSVVLKGFSQTVFSKFLGANRITVVRLFKTLKELGLSECTKKGCYISDLQRLEKYQLSISL